jgi:hypothetical protein
MDDTKLNRTECAAPVVGEAKAVVQKKKKEKEDMF